MAHYVCMVTFTDTGVKNLRKTTVRSEAFRKKMEKLGLTFVATLWTVGMFDMVHIFEAPDDQAAGVMAFTLSSFGNVRTNTMRAFTAEEMETMINNVQTPYDLLDEKESI